MTTNDVLVRQDFITQVLFKNDNFSLSSDLKVKIMAMRIEYSKIRKAFDEDVQSFIKENTPEGFTELQQKTDRTEDETKELQAMVDKLNAELRAYMEKRSLDPVTINNSTLTMDEFTEIVKVMGDIDSIKIRDIEYKSADYLEVLYNLFVNE